LVEQKGFEMTLDIERLRRETPGCEHVLHFNNAGASLMPQRVLDAVVEHLQLEARIGGYEAAAQAAAKVARVYDAAAELLGARREEIAVVENATRAWDLAFYGIPFRAGDRILAGVAEYGSNFLAMLQVTRKTGAVVEVIPNDEHGQISIVALRRAMDERVKLIALTHVPTGTGLVNPAAEVGKIAREFCCLYLLDACQSVGQMPTRVDELQCDLLATSSRKFLRGPRGMGFLYVRKSVLEKLEPPFVDTLAANWLARDRFEWRPDARRFENWEANYAAKIGMSVAIDYCLSLGIESIWARTRMLAEKLRTRLAAIDGARVHDVGAEKCGIVTFTVSGWDSTKLAAALREKQMNVSVSGAFGLRLGEGDRNLSDTMRASVHYYNTEEEIERFGETIERMSAS
jgi:selenocysteine lyase/cysteine desulfurase